MPSADDVGKPASSPDAANASKQDEGSTEVTDLQRREPAEELFDEPDLLTQARDFLSSPAIRPQSVSIKRDFLLKKGLSPEQTENLLEEADVPPPIPPRTYLPQPPPSQLPGLLASLLRTLGILGAASGAGLWIYHSLIFPRLSDSFAARDALRKHQVELFKSLKGQLETLEANITPKPDDRTILGEYSEGVGEDRIGEPILDIADLPRQRADYNALPSALENLASLASSHPTNQQSTSFASLSTTSQRTLQSLTDLNAYIASETFNIPSPSSFRLNSANNVGSRALGPVEEELRRELRALKGLVLNRRSFTPTSIALSANKT